MLTPWGEIAVADAHVHFFSHRFLGLLCAQRGQSAEDAARFLEWEPPPQDPRELALRWARELDEHGLARAALIASAPGDEASVAAAVAACPGRFHGYFMFNPLEENPAERARAAFESGLRVVCLFPAMHRYAIWDDRVRPVLEESARVPGRAVFVHCGVLSVGLRKRLGLPSLFDMRYSNPIDLHGVALRYPGLPFIVPHFGAGYLREALMLAELCPNVYLDTSSSNRWMRYQGLDLKTVFERALEAAGAERLLFGTDSSFFPRGWNAEVFEAQERALEDLGIGTRDAHAIFGGNLDRLLGSAAPQAR
ncbi:MAG TPA: amidohydrolase family protein [Bryobacteraceae bacterium]|nr:amidohydrolase family protein [Bryobacteraceae bacterium]